MSDGPPGEGCPVLSHISPNISHYDGLSVYHGWSGLAIPLSLRWLTSFFNFLFLTSTLLSVSSRNWCLITGKARSWSEGSHWLWEETDLQGVGERWLSRFTCEKTKPLFPSAGSLPKSTAAHTSVASKGNKKSPVPDSRLAFFFLPHFCGCLCAPEMLAPLWAPGCPQSRLCTALWRHRGSPRWEAGSGTAAHAWHYPQLWHPEHPRAWAGGSSQCLPTLRDTLGTYKWDHKLP